MFGYSVLKNLKTNILFATRLIVQCYRNIVVTNVKYTLKRMIPRLENLIKNANQFSINIFLGLKRSTNQRVFAFVKQVSIESVIPHKKNSITIIFIVFFPVRFDLNAFSNAG